MKKIFILSLLTLFSVAVFAQVDAQKPVKKQKANVVKTDDQLTKKQKTKHANSDEKSAKKQNSKKKEVIVEDTLPKLPEIKFTYLIYDYGTVKKNGDGVSFFEFKNIGRADLQLTNVSSSCGCTVPSWPKDPIPPGGTAQIKVSYNTGKVGPINKNVYVDSNAGERITLTIKGNVVEQQEVVPENRPSQIIKNE
jgi:hypothetical protein